MSNEVQKTIIAQVREQVFVKAGQVVLVDDATVMFHFKTSATVTNIDVRYVSGSDLYEVSVYKFSRKTYKSKTEVITVYAEDLGRFFPPKLVKDENVKAFFAQIAAARAV